MEKKRKFNIKRRRLIRPVKKAVRQKIARVVNAELTRFVLEDEHPSAESAQPLHTLD